MPQGDGKTAPQRLRRAIAPGRGIAVGLRRFQDFRDPERFSRADKTNRGPQPRLSVVGVGPRWSADLEHPRKSAFSSWNRQSRWLSFEMGRADPGNHWSDRGASAGRRETGRTAEGRYVLQLLLIAPKGKISVPTYPFGNESIPRNFPQTSARLSKANLEISIFLVNLPLRISPSAITLLQTGPALLGILAFSALLKGMRTVRLL